MAQAILLRGGAGGISSDDVTASKAQVLQGYKTVTTDSDDEIVEGTFPTTSDADSMEEFWYYNDHGEDSYVTRILEAAYMRHWNADRTQSWNPWIRIKRTLIKSGINYHPELTIDTITTLGERGQIPDRGESAGVSYYQIREDHNGRLYVLFKNGWYHRAPWTDPQGHTHEAYLYVTYEQLRNLFGIDGSKMLQGHNVAGVAGQIVSHPNENMTVEIVNINWTNPKKFGFRFPQGYYPNAGQYAPIVEVNYQDLANALGIRADKMLNDINILGVQGNIPYWVCYTGDVISALNNEGFAWDDTYAGRGRGIVAKIPNSHVIAGANYVFLPSPNLQPWNIRQNVNVNGVTGTMVDYGAGGVPFNGATFDNRLISGVANKGFILNGIGRYLNLKSGTGGYVGIQDGGLKLYNGYGGNTRFKTASDVGFVFSKSINLTPFRYIKIGFKFIEFRGDGTGAQPARIELEVGATPISGAGGEVYHNESNTVVRDIGGRSNFATYTMTSTRTNAGNQSDMSQQYLTLDVSASQGHHFVYITFGNIVHEYSAGSVYAVAIVNHIEFIN